MRKNYLWYQMFRYPIVGAGLKLFFKKIKVSGRKNLPKNKPILFVPNHQNSFMDALLVVCNSRPFIYFLTRAEAFSPAPVGWFLRTLNMLPVYRVRDGFSSVQKNEEIFERCFRYLKRNDAVLIFAEANHDLKRRIRPLSKGFTRIAFGAEEKSNWELDLQVVPVGINYSEHTKSREPVQVKFGEPIPVKKYRKEYEEDANEASRNLKEETSKGMKKIVMHVPNLDHYPLHKVLLEDLETDREKLIDPDTANKRVDLINNNFSEEMLKKAKKVHSMSEEHDINLRMFTEPKKVKPGDILLFPLYLFSLINNLIPYQPIRWLTTKVIQDHAFDSSIKFLTGITLFPVFYLLVCLAFGLAGADNSWILSYFISSLVTAPLFVRARDLFTPDPAKKFRKSNPEAYREIQSLLEELDSFRNSLF